MLTWYTNTKCSVLWFTPTINLSSYIDSDWMCFSCSNLNYALERWNKLRLGHCLQARVFLPKTEHSILVASHRVDVAILGKEVGMSLSTGNLFDEDVITAHFRQFYHRWVWLFIKVCCVVCACILCFKAKLTKFGVSHDIDLSVSRHKYWLLLLSKDWSCMVLQRLFLGSLIVNLNFILTHHAIWTSLGCWV